jgi:hypothetical protein
LLAAADILKLSRIQVTQAATGSDAPQPNRYWNASRRQDDRASAENLFTHGVFRPPCLVGDCAAVTRNGTLVTEASGGCMA